MKVKFNLPLNYDNIPISQRRLVREQYIVEQHGRCIHCGALLTESPAKIIMKAYIDWSLFPKLFRKYPIHLHHSHDTGMTIGAIHMRCNAYLWQYKGE